MSLEESLHSFQSFLSRSRRSFRNEAALGVELHSVPEEDSRLQQERAEILRILSQELDKVTMVSHCDARTVGKARLEMAPPPLHPTPPNHGKSNCRNFCRVIFVGENLKYWAQPLPARSV